VLCIAHYLRRKKDTKYLTAITVNSTYPVKDINEVLVW